jgi:8-oxo-dGTP pyrophosphatase MutT (NUDIX family)
MNCNILARTFIFLFALVIAMANHSAEAAYDVKPFIGAGILPYAEQEGRLYILLGYDLGRGWTGFGGGPEMVSSVAKPTPRWESPKETALREGFEECRMVISLTELEEGIDGARYFPASHDPKAFRTFTVKVTYRPVAVFRNRAVPVKSVYAETKEYFWVPLEQLCTLVRSGRRELDGAPNDEALWETFYEGLRPLFASDDYRKYFPK